MRDTAIGPGMAPGSALDRQTDALLKRVGPQKLTSGPVTTGATGATPATGTAAENKKIDKSAADFESILLGTWLQQAEQSFAKVPGGDGEDDDADPGKDQLQEVSVQSLAGALTASGGIGLAKMISAQLKKSETAQVSNADLAATLATTQQS